MKREIIYNEERIFYEIKKSRRAKRVRLSVTYDASVKLTVPWRTDEKTGEKFLYQNINWLKKKITERKNKNLNIPSGNRQDYLKHKELARDIIRKRLEYFNAFYNFSWNKISIRNSRTRWGSCSQKGNLNFSYRLIYLPEELRDFIIVHELCHLKEMNHSPRFWKLVEKAVPDYKKRRKKLKI